MHDRHYTTDDIRRPSIIKQNVATPCTLKMKDTAFSHYFTVRTPVTTPFLEECEKEPVEKCRLIPTSVDEVRNMLNTCMYKKPTISNQVSYVCYMQGFGYQRHILDIILPLF